jgi:hypothetical protein
MLLWSGAMYFFTRANYNTDIGPENSRQLAGDCLIGKINYLFQYFFIDGIKK